MVIIGVSVVLLVGFYLVDLLFGESELFIVFNVGMLVEYLEVVYWGEWVVFSEVVIVELWEDKYFFFFGFVLEVYSVECIWVGCFSG